MIAVTAFLAATFALGLAVMAAAYTHRYPRRGRHRMNT